MNPPVKASSITFLTASKAAFLRELKPVRAAKSAHPHYQDPRHPLFLAKI